MCDNQSINQIIGEISEIPTQQLDERKKEENVQDTETRVFTATAKAGGFSKLYAYA